MNLFVLWRQKCSVCSSWSRPSSLSWDSRGEIHFPAPPFLTLCRAFISCGLRPYRPRRRALSLLVRLRWPTHRPLRLPPNRAVRSLPLCCAYRTFWPGGTPASFHIPIIMRNYDYIVAYHEELDQGEALFYEWNLLIDEWFGWFLVRSGGTGRAGCRGRGACRG